MKPITKLASSTLPDGSVLDLWERDGFHFLLRDGVQTASSFSHGSNEAAAAMAAAPVKRANQPSFLLDGLSLGFTLFALMDEIRRGKGPLHRGGTLQTAYRLAQGTDEPGTARILRTTAVSAQFYPGASNRPQESEKLPRHSVPFHARTHEPERSRSFRAILPHSSRAVCWSLR